MRKWGNEEMGKWENGKVGKGFVLKTLELFETLCALCPSEPPPNQKLSFDRLRNHPQIKNNPSTGSGTDPNQK